MSLFSFFFFNSPYVMSFVTVNLKSAVKCQVLSSLKSVYGVFDRLYVTNMMTHVEHYSILVGVLPVIHYYKKNAEFWDAVFIKKTHCKKLNAKSIIYARSFKKRWTYPVMVHNSCHFFAECYWKLLLSGCVDKCLSL